MICAPSPKNVFSRRLAALLWLLLAAASLLLTLRVDALQAETPARVVSAAEFRKLLQQQNGKVVVVNLWATWCVPCLREVPDLLKLEAEFAVRGVVLIGVAVDDPTPGAAQVEQFRRKYFPAFLTYARGGSEMDELASVIDPAWNEVVPTTYILDRQGKAVVRIQGKKSLEAFRAEVPRAL